MATIVEQVTARAEKIAEEIGHDTEYMAIMLKRIILIRKEVEPKKYLQKLHNTITSDLAFFIQTVDRRWINSVVDSYVDHGDPRQRMQALLLSNHYCNLVAMAGIQDLMAGETVPPKYPPSGHEFPHGNKFSNLFRRIDQTIVDEPFRTIWEQERRLLDANETSYAILAKHNRFGFYRRMERYENLAHFINYYDLTKRVEFGTQGFLDRFDRLQVNSIADLKDRQFNLLFIDDVEDLELSDILPHCCNRFCVMGGNLEKNREKIGDWKYWLGVPIIPLQDYDGAWSSSVIFKSEIDLLR